MMVRHVLPYAVRLLRDDSGRWRLDIRDREYQRIALVRLRRKPTDALLSALAWNGEVNGGGNGDASVWLYSDGCKPEHAWPEYARRLKRLAGIRLADAPAERDSLVVRTEGEASGRAGLAPDDL